MMGGEVSLCNERNRLLGPLVSLTVLMLWPLPAWSIPSPDLVVNMFGSAAQLLGLSTVLLGAGFLGKRRSGAKTGVSRGWRRLFYAVGALLLVSLVANLLQYTWQADEKNRRLQTNLWRSSTEDGKQVGDASLKTLKFSDQLKHPRGIGTDTLQAWVKEGRPLNLIDVRESEEYEMGYISGARHSRYPDTRRNARQLLSPTQENVLLCYSGNRSSELCTEFTKEGYQCRFMIGGYEKWMAEERTLSASDGEVATTLRGLPDYPNKHILLDTPKVMDMVSAEQALFVDVRYPGDFENGHLSGAVNLPVRKLTSEELAARLEELPRRPIIAPCYDKRSCFYAEILGLKLSRLGYDYRGRYSVPHEFALPAKEKAFVARWKTMQQGRTLMDIGLTPLRDALTSVHESTGYLAAAILVLVLALRLLVVPISIKAERDGVVQRRIAPEIQSLKERWRDDPKRQSRAVMKLYRREGLTPGRNLIGTSVQLVLFILFFSAVNTASQGVREPFLWVPALGAPDPLWILPLIVGGLIFAQLLTTTTKRDGLRWAMFVGISALLVAMTVPLNAAVNLYLVLSISFILAQGRVVSFVLARRERRAAQVAAPEPAPDTGVIKLAQAHRVPTVGNKAGRLGQMLEAGLPVPNGFVVTSRLIFCLKPQCQCALQGGEARLILDAFQQLGADKVAVRSSGLSEDGSEQSFAGVYESILNISQDQLLDALNEVRESFCNQRAHAYAGGPEEQGSVLVQAMVDAEYAGVLFTQHPTSSGCMLVELVQGLGEKLVSGSATPHAFRYGRASGAALDETEAPVDLAALIALGRQVEGLFGRPQDIEWAYAQGRFYVLQSRDITTPVTAGNGKRAALERERSRVLDIVASGSAAVDETILEQNELAELLPRPTPLSLSLMEALWDIGGTTDIACSRLGVPYDVDEDSAPYLVTAFGGLYVNRVEEKRRLSDGPGALASFRLSRAADDIESAFTQDFLPGFMREMRLREALDLAQFPTGELIHLFDQWVNHFIAESYVHAETINIAADFYLKVAERSLEKHGLNPATYLGHGPLTITHRAMALLPAIRAGDSRVEEFLRLFGHRAVHDYELSEPRYREDSELVTSLVDSAILGAEAKIPDAPLPDERLLALSVERARRFQSLKEDAKHHSMRALASLRPVLLELDRRLGLDGNIFYLCLDEIAHIDGPVHDHVFDIVTMRRNEAAVYDGTRLPTDLSIKQVEGLEFDASGRVRSRTAHPGALSGERVSSDKEIIGTVRIVEDLDKAHEFQDGEIIVARFTDPRWTPLFPKAAGIVTEVGGWLSHMAIVAREYELPCIVGVHGATQELQTGQQVRLRADGVVDRRLQKGERRQRPDAAEVDAERRQAPRREGDRRRAA